MAILSVTPENSLLWAFLMQNFNLVIAKMSVISESVTAENHCIGLGLHTCHVIMSEDVRT